jgi:hypothetical protein
MRHRRRDDQVPGPAELRLRGGVPGGDDPLRRLPVPGLLPSGNGMPAGRVVQGAADCVSDRPPGRLAVGDPPDNDCCALLPAKFRLEIHRLERDMSGLGPVDTQRRQEGG